MIVEVDESLFTRRKNNAGRILPQQWIFGGICRETKQSFVQLVPDRTMKTITEAIHNNIEEGSVLYSDSWRSYCTTALEEAGFKHFTQHKHHLESYLAEFQWRQNVREVAFMEILEAIKNF